MKIKTSELTGPALDWAVAKTEGWAVMTRQAPKRVLLANGDDWELLCTPSTDWSQGGPIIEQMRPLLEGPQDDETQWWCSAFTALEEMNHPVGVYGPTPLIAAMRCFVASKLGDEVDVPEELLS